MKESVPFKHAPVLTRVVTKESENKAQQIFNK